MDKTNYTTELRKGQHLTSEERHEIEVRYNKDKWSIYKIAKSLHRPYNTIKNEIKRGTVLLYNGTVKRYKADVGYKAYLENRQESRRLHKNALPLHRPRPSAHQEHGPSRKAETKHKTA